jgi:hypothetical protein
MTAEALVFVIAVIAGNIRFSLFEALRVTAKPEMLHPEATTSELTRPSGSGNLVHLQQSTRPLVLL